MAMALKRGHGTYDGFVRNLPGKILDAPSLLPGLDIFFEAFLDLTSSRMQGVNGPGPIPFSEIDAWARRYEIDEDTFERLQLFIRRMDKVYIEHVVKKSKK